MTLLKDLRHIILYAISAAILVLVLKLLQWKFLILDNSVDIYVGLIAVFFTILGIWVAQQLARPKIQTVVVEKPVYIIQQGQPAIDEMELERLNLSNREYEILKLISIGRSNADISKELFLSLSTVKTHVSNLYFKLDVKSRTQAIEKAKRTRIIS